MRNERLQEIKQIKGQSETTPILSPNDDFANFEVLNYLLGDPAGRIDHQHGSYIREALRNGLGMQQARGYNPYKFGIVGGSDSHNTGVPYRQDNFFGGHALNDGDMKERMAGHVFAGLDVRLENPAGLTGVWAEENTRASLFEAMQRKETYRHQRRAHQVADVRRLGLGTRRVETARPLGIQCRVGEDGLPRRVCRWAATCRRRRAKRRRSPCMR